MEYSGSVSDVEDVQNRPKPKGLGRATTTCSNWPRKEGTHETKAQWQEMATAARGKVPRKWGHNPGTRLG